MRKHKKRIILSFAVSALAWPLVSWAMTPLVHESQNRSSITSRVISSPDDPYREFKPALEIVMDKMIKSYQAHVDAKLVVTVLDSDGAGAGDLISQFSTHSAYDPTISLGIHFEKNVKSNGQKASVCTLQYRPEGIKNIIKSYERSKVFSRKDILHYIAAHEMGHCLAYHQSSLGEFKNLSIKEHELLADKFAVSFFYINNEPKSARKIVEFNRNYAESETHRHPEALERYVDYLDVLFKDHTPKSLISSTLDLFYLASDQGEKI